MLGEVDITNQPIQKFMMKISMYKKICHLPILLIICANSHAQAIESNSLSTIAEVLQFTNDIYGEDQQFLNGTFHEYKYWNALGHPFFQENEFIEGDLVLHGKLYHSIPMKYDIYSQELIVYTSIDNRELAFYPPAEFISSFTIYGKDFERITHIYETPTYFQVVAKEEQISCLYFWFKTRQESDHRQTFSSYKFDNSKYKNYLIINTEVFRYNSNRSFKKSFPENIQNEISSYLKSRKIHVRRGNDIEMKECIKYCQTLLNGIE